MEQREYKVVIVNPNTSVAFTEKIQSIVNSFTSQYSGFTVTNPSSGPRSIEGFFDEILSAQPTLTTILEHAPNVDGIIVACYSAHPAINAAREVLRIPVIGIMEASLYMALPLGYKFSVVTTNERWVPMLHDGIKQLGLESRCASVRSTHMPVLALEEEGDHIVNKLAEESRKAISEDGAEVICLGCAGMVGINETLEETLSVPVIDGVIASVAYMESLLRCKLKTSKKRCYGQPQYKPLDNLNKDLGQWYQ